MSGVVSKLCMPVSCPDASRAGVLWHPADHAAYRRTISFDAKKSWSTSCFTAGVQLSRRRRPVLEGHSRPPCAAAIDGDAGGGRGGDSERPPSVPLKNGWHLFSEEPIGAEHGEGFASFRPKGPLHVDVDYLNDRMKKRGLQRIRYAMRPDEAFGLVYSWDNVLGNTRALQLEAWVHLAAEEGKNIGDAVTQRRLLSMGAERAIRQVLMWTQEQGEVARLAGRLAELYCEKFAELRAPLEGAREWLAALDTAGVPCAVASSMDRRTLLAALDRMGLRNYFQAVVTEEDGMDSIANRFLSAAVKLDRPPAKCVVFEDDPRGIAAAHNCSMKVVALIGTHPAYELKQADLTVGSFSDLSIINLRRLFAARGLEFMDLQKAYEDKKPPKRRLRNDTLF